MQGIPDHSVLRFPAVVTQVWTDKFRTNEHRFVPLVVLVRLFNYKPLLKLPLSHCGFQTPINLLLPCLKNGYPFLAQVLAELPIPDFSLSRVLLVAVQVLDDAALCRPFWQLRSQLKALVTSQETMVRSERRGIQKVSFEVLEQS